MKPIYFFLVADVVVEFAPRRILQHDENVGGRIDELEVLDDVGVVELSQGADLALDLLEHAELLYFLPVQDFDGHLVTCQFVVSH